MISDFKEEVFYLTPSPQLPEVYVKYSTFNHKKHKQTCERNRLKRKKKK